MAFWGPRGASSGSGFEFQTWASDRKVAQNDLLKSIHTSNDVNSDPQKSRLWCAHHAICALEGVHGLVGPSRTL